MGRDFRGASYYRNCWIGKRTIKEGESAVVWNRYGKHRVVKGPYLKRMFFQQIQFMDAYSCSEEEYLQVRFKDGHTEHINGPTSMFSNPVTHKFVKSMPAIHLASKLECLVVSRQVGLRPKHVSTDDEKRPQESDGLLLNEIGEDENKRACGEESGRQRMIVKGPLMFFPKVGDKIELLPWLHGTAKVELNGNTHTMEIPVCVNGGGKLGMVTLACRFSIHDLQLLVDTTPDLLTDMTQTLIAAVLSLTSSISSSSGPLSPEDFEPCHEAKLRELLSTPSNFASFADWCDNTGVTVALSSGVTFKHFKVDQVVTLHREQLRKDQKARKVSEEKAIRAAKAHEQQLRDSNSTFEREMAEQRARLEAKRDQLNVEQELAEKKQELELSLLRTRQENQLEHAKKSNDELVRVATTIHKISPDINLIDILDHISVAGPKKPEKKAEKLDKANARQPNLESSAGPQMWVRNTNRC